MKKTLLTGASTGIVAGMLIMGTANTALAENSEYLMPAYTQDSPATGMHIMHRWNSSAKINSLAASLGIDKIQINEELKSRKSLKQILQDNGIVPFQLQKAFENKRKNNKSWKNHINFI